MIALRQAETRGRTDAGWLDSRHTFSFGEYYDPAAMGFSVLRVINDDRVAPGAGFPTHGHRDMEILSYVLEGGLEHKDSLGTGSIIRPGELQRMTAGTGVRHSEKNASTDEPVHFLQIWLLPARQGLVPGYEQKAFPDSERSGRLRLVASSDGRDNSVLIQQDASLFIGLFAASEPRTPSRPDVRPTSTSRVARSSFAPATGRIDWRRAVAPPSPRKPRSRSSARPRVLTAARRWSSTCPEPPGAPGQRVPALGRSVAQQRGAIVEGLCLQQAQLDALGQGTEQRPARAHDHGIDDQLEFVDQTLLGQVAHQAAAAEDQTVAALRTFDPLDGFPVRRRFDDCVFPGRLLERRGKHDLLSLGEDLGEIRVRGFARRCGPEAGEHLVGVLAEQIGGDVATGLFDVLGAGGVSVVTGTGSGGMTSGRQGLAGASTPL
jgi:hypothetical protein